MFRLYTPILILQGFCLYHAYSNKSPYYWYLFIALVPLIGCAFYLYVHFFTRSNVEDVSEFIKETVNADYTVDKLIKQAHVADTVTNKVQLADEYMNRWEPDQAIVLYESCLTGFNANDPDTLMKLMFAYYRSEQFDKVMTIGERLKESKVFQFSDAKLAYADAAAKMKKFDEADQLFEELNVRFANHEHRLAFANYLLDREEVKHAKTLLGALTDEINHMDAAERRLKRQIIREIEALHRSL